MGYKPQHIVRSQAEYAEKLNRHYQIAVVPEPITLEVCPPTRRLYVQANADLVVRSSYSLEKCYVRIASHWTPRITLAGTGTTEVWCLDIARPRIYAYGMVTLDLYMDHQSLPTIYGLGTSRVNLHLLGENAPILHWRTEPAEHSAPVLLPACPAQLHRPHQRSLILN